MKIKLAIYLSMLAFLLSLDLMACRPIAWALIPETAFSELRDLRPLPGKLDSIPVLNSNSPEVVQQPGILVSTFPPGGKRCAAAHLNFPFLGRFDIFAHHIAKGIETNIEIGTRTLYIGIVLGNSGKRPAKVSVLASASYLSQPDAPFVAQPAQCANDDGLVFAGPGDRAMLDVLRGLQSPLFPKEFVVPPGRTYLLAALPVPVQGLTPPLNGRSTLIRLSSDRPVYGATLAMFAKKGEGGQEQAPCLEDWQALLQDGELAGPREKAPTALAVKSNVIYGRVAGVAAGDKWMARLTDDPGKSGSYLTVPAPAGPLSYPIASVIGGAFGTKQVQSAPIVVREPDTAWQAHGNYGVEYDIKIPLYNEQPDVSRTVTLTLQTPLKKDDGGQSLFFLNPPAANVFFRGTVRVSYDDDLGCRQAKLIHLVQHRGEVGQPLLTLTLSPKQQRTVDLSFIYPPDATPPQVLTISTIR